MSGPDKPPRTFDVESYREFERKMILFEEGPTTTRFEQLMTRGVALPDSESISDDDIEALLLTRSRTGGTARLFSNTRIT